MADARARAKPSRADLLKVIERLQGLIGKAQGHLMNDRAPDRMETTTAALREAFELAVHARRHDP